MPLRWSSFLIIELNYPFQASYRVSAPVSIGRSFNNWAFQLCISGLPFRPCNLLQIKLLMSADSYLSMAISSMCLLDKHVPNWTFELVNVNNMAAKFWSTSITGFADVDNAQQMLTKGSLIEPNSTPSAGFEESNQPPLVQWTFAPAIRDISVPLLRSVQQFDGHNSPPKAKISLLSDILG